MARSAATKKAGNYASPRQTDTCWNSQVVWIASIRSQ
jgi:hypothetical protein